jgi:hypothetical protein
LAGSLLVVFFNIHYIAPIVPVIVALLVQCLRHLRLWNWDGRPTGRFLARATVVMCVLLIPAQVQVLAAAPPPGSEGAVGLERTAIEDELRALPEPQLVLVRYDPNHDALLEWVYNDADPDHAKIVWARDMGAQQNEELLHYYSDRRVWLLDGDAISPQLAPYVKSAESASAAIKAGENK